MTDPRGRTSGNAPGNPDENTARNRPGRDDATHIDPRAARQAEIILDTRRKRWRYVAILGLAVVFLLIAFLAAIPS
ncbi:hypothetical protein OCH7691_02768 [Oceanibacterium hippocampi]|uniref:Protoheme IX farnesyltransferase n=2 Tax=Oceanibacterium hippocampi TaxID=745714 RepID=A0A1Y5TFB2_9PROT|nr:hypothetical protein OCH7691_02768 [Oceanibacterium hippocampi]